MKIKHALLLILSLAVTGIGAQNCGGSIVRNYNMKIARSTVDSQLASVGQASLDANGQSAVNTFTGIANTEGATVYYSEAPGSMGDIGNVMPAIQNMGLAVPAKAHVYFAFLQATDGAHAALLITSDTDVLFAATSDDSTSNLKTGQFTDSDFTITINGSGQEITVRCYDVVDGNDLADAIQLELDDESSGQELLIGVLNLVAATD